MSLKAATRTFVSVFAATLVLTGCGQAPEAETGASAEAADVQPLRVWRTIQGDDGVALALLGEGDRQIFHLACLRSPARMVVTAEEATVIGSEERLTLGVGQEAYLFVADTQSGRPGVQAEGPIDAGLLERLAEGVRVEAVYGAQRIGPFDLPMTDILAEFTQGCREIARGAGSE